MSAPLLDRLAPLRNLGEMAAYVFGIIRVFPEAERADVAEELIDRAERKGAITAETAVTLRETFELQPVSSGRRA